MLQTVVWSHTEPEWEVPSQGTCPRSSESAILQGKQKQSRARLLIIPLWCYYMAELTPVGLLCLHNDLAELPKRDFHSVFYVAISLRLPTWKHIECESFVNKQKAASF